MIYYTKDGKIVNYNGSNNSMMSGTQGKIFRLNSSVCLKEYSKDSEVKSIFDDDGTRFNQEMFDYFKNNYSNSNMGELYDLLYDKKLMTVLGYTMKYYEEVIDNILNMPVSYILDNFSLIYDLVIRLTDECIRIVDMHSGNIISTENGLIVIDYDKYYFDRDSSKEVLSYINKSALMSTFCGIFRNSLKKMGIDVDNNQELNNKISSLFTIGTTPLVLKYKLRSYNKSIDYIMNHR